MSDDLAFDAAITMINAEYARLSKLVEGLNQNADEFVAKHGDSYFCTDVTRLLVGTAQSISKTNKQFTKPLQHILPWR